MNNVKSKVLSLALSAAVSFSALSAVPVFAGGRGNNYNSRNSQYTRDARGWQGKGNTSNLKLGNLGKDNNSVDLQVYQGQGTDEQTITLDEALNSNNPLNVAESTYTGNDYSNIVTQLNELKKQLVQTSQVINKIKTSESQITNQINKLKKTKFKVSQLEQAKAKLANLQNTLNTLKGYETKYVAQFNELLKQYDTYAQQVKNYSKTNNNKSNKKTNKNLNKANDILNDINKNVKSKQKQIKSGGLTINGNVNINININGSSSDISSLKDQLNSYLNLNK